MSLKNWLAGFCLAVLLVSEFFLFQANRAKNAALEQAAGAKQTADELRSELDQTNTADAAEISRLQNDLQGLRGQVTMLLAEKKKLTNQLNSVLADAQQQQNQMQQQQEQMLQLQTENDQARVAMMTAQSALERDQCIANLRLIDQAKQQWAQINSKPDDAIPTAKDLAPFLPGGVFPVCPSGGTYTIGKVGEPPTCSIPGHALPQ
ncbi:MAG TPA: hypothetical protein VMB22_00505 [Verrucomicrobiae bacterium]|nr:hypothetical protein [Verrucomicrobiae bacterium]